MSARVLIVTGDGINCEREMARAFSEEGGHVSVVHVNTLLENPRSLLDYAVFGIPGGFSFGDELRSGKIFAEKLRERLLGSLRVFTEQGGLTIGICNGFQVLMQLGVFEAGLSGRARTVTLGTNDHGEFRDRWVGCEISADATRSPWFRGMSGILHLPVRHKEGRIISRSAALTIPIRYTEEINGSFERSAGLLDASGRILGLMPHPEAATHGFLNPLLMNETEKNQNAEKVRHLFRNAVKS
ncbi:MAG: phosphoribosylformylglycinamidine synthase subunit PurQ [Proteobacteria bacterium]|nr:phosphoribosylformylglycinamidine synthase subunit PurQ [Pseudomonadota bacterium]